MSFWHSLHHTKKESIPCGCTAWRKGGTYGVLMCPQHFHLHYIVKHDDWTGDGCDCLLHRAEAANVDPLTYAEGVEAAAVAEYRAWERKVRGESDKPDDRNGDVDPSADVEEVDRKCPCVWLRRAGEWRIKSACPEHSKKWSRRGGKKLRQERERQRNERGW